MRGMSRLQIAGQPNGVTRKLTALKVTAWRFKRKVIGMVPIANFPGNSRPDSRRFARYASIRSSSRHSY